MGKLFYKYQSIIFVLINCCWLSCQSDKRTDWNENYDRQSKQPFGYRIAYENLDEIFPTARIKAGKKMMAEIREYNTSRQNQSGHIILAVGKNLQFSSDELNELLLFVRNGNGLLMLADHYSDNIYQHFGVNPSRGNPEWFGLRDTLHHQTLNLFYSADNTSYFYSGLPVQNHFKMNNTFNRNYILGYNKLMHYPNVIQDSSENGLWILSCIPGTFTNHFMLSDSNRQYYERLLSNFSEYPQSVSWYNYRVKSENEDTQKSSWSSLLKFPPLRYAFLLILALLTLYAIFQSKRRQRIIQVIQQPGNASLEFVETVGLLYLNKGNHRNMADKMIHHFFELVRTRYALNPKELHTEFTISLSRKTGQSIAETQSFIDYLAYIRQQSVLSEEDLRNLYHRIQKFIPHGNSAV